MNFIEPIQVKSLGGIKNSLCVNNDKGNPIYDFVFGEISYKILEHYVQQMQSETEMSFIEGFTYFIGLQVKQLRDIFTKTLDNV